MPLPERPPPEVPESAFADADEDESGLLDREEFTKLLESLGMDAKPGEFDKADEDSDGTINFVEFLVRETTLGNGTPAANCCCMLEALLARKHCQARTHEHISLCLPVTFVALTPCFVAL